MHAATGGPTHPPVGLITVSVLWFGSVGTTNVSVQSVLPGFGSDPTLSCCVRVFEFLGPLGSGANTRRENPRPGFRVQLA